MNTVHRIFGVFLAVLGALYIFVALGLGLLLLFFTTSKFVDHLIYEQVFEFYHRTFWLSLNMFIFNAVLWILVVIADLIKICFCDSLSKRIRFYWEN